MALRLVELVAGSGRDALEVGGGVGAVQIELLRAGAARATCVELSPAYEEEAEALAREAGVEDRIDRRLLDFARAGGDVGSADIVVMHRVVCCYPDMPALVGAAAAHARRVLALSYPPDSWLFRAGARVVNFVSRVRRQEFRFFVHPPAAIANVAGDHGLTRTLHERRRFWEIATFERP